MARERIQRQVDPLLNQAEEAMGQMKWDSVRDCAQAVLGLDSENAEALAFLDSADRVLRNQLSGGTHEIQGTPPTAQTDQPTSFANGRHEVKRFLGEGGKKRGYLAQDTLLDREVAFALIKTECLDEVSRTRITREALAPTPTSSPCSTRSRGRPALHGH